MEEEYVGTLFQRIRLSETLFVFKPISSLNGFLMTVSTNDTIIPDDPNEDENGYYFFTSNGTSYTLLSNVNQFDEEYVVGNLKPISELIDVEDEEADLDEALNIYSNESDNEVYFGTTDDNAKLKIFKIEKDELLDGNMSFITFNTRSIFENIFKELDTNKEKKIDVKLVKELFHIAESNVCASKELIGLTATTHDFEGILSFLHDKAETLAKSFPNDEDINSAFEFFKNYLTSFRNIKDNTSKEVVALYIESIKHCIDTYKDDVDNHIENICRYANYEKIKDAFDELEEFIKSHQKKTYSGLYERLNEVVIGQEDAKRTVLVSIFKSDNDVINKNNLLLVGPSGCGKTLIAETCAEYLDIPSIVVDSTTLSTPGYVGQDVDQQLVRLLEAAGGNLEKAQRGIVIFDEIDKKGSKDNDDVSGRGVLNCLLGFIEGRKYQIVYKNRPVEFDTSKLKIIMTGAFAKVAEELEIENKKSNFGFISIDSKNEEVKVSLSDKDITTKGDMPPEFIGRVLIVNLSKLTKDNAKELMYYSERSILRDIYNLYIKYDTKVYFTEEFVDGFINSLFDNKEDEFGARTINKKISEVLLSAEFELILSLDKENGYKEVVVGIEALTDHNKILFIYEDGTSRELGDIIKEQEEKKAKEKAMRDIPEFIKRKVNK